MKHLKKTFGLLCAVATISSPAFAGYYDGPNIDVDIILHPPAKYDYCARYENSTVKVYRACEFGVDEASRMAERYAGGQGRVDGYLQGYTWGFYKMANSYQNDSTEMAEGAAVVDSLNDYLQKGIDAGIRKGESNGSQEGAQEARNRFYRAVDSGKMPSSKVVVPASSYAGESNAYQKYVGSIPTIKEILEETEDALFYDKYDTVYLGDILFPSTKELWGYNGKYEFDQDRLYNTDRAWKAWTRLPLSTKADYDNLNVGAEYVTVTTETGEVVETDELVVDYKAVFKDAFKNSYNYYVNYYYSINFHTDIGTGQAAGEAFGLQVGKRVAHTKGLANAFNYKFKESSKLFYKEAYESSYEDSFRRTYNSFASNPKLSLSIVDVIGVMNDGILQAGEEFKVVFKVVNAGGVPSALNASVSGNVIKGKTQDFAIRKLQSQTYVTDVIGQIDPRLKPRERAVIRLRVNGLTDSMNETINTLVEFVGSNYDVDVVTGTGAVIVKTKNISTVTAPTNVVATLKQGGQTLNTVYGKILAAGESEALRLTFSDVDPLELILNGVKFNADITFGKATIDQISLSVQSDNRDEDLVEYFVQLIKGDGVVPMGTSKDQRLEKVRLALKDLNFRETKRGKKAKNYYAKAPNKTIIGKLVAAKKAMDNSETAIREFHKMGQLLYPARKNLNQFLFWGKKVDYDKLLNQLSETGHRRDLK